MSNGTSAERTCFFGHHPIEGKAELHHKVCRRYFKGGQDHRRGNLVPACHEHHLRFHKEIDCPKWSKRTFMERMSKIDFGEGIFAGD